MDSAYLAAPVTSIAKVVNIHQKMKLLPLLQRFFPGKYTCLCALIIIRLQVIVLYEKYLIFLFPPERMGAPPSSYSSSSSSNYNEVNLV
jgi:hypothetical protein